MQAWPWRVESRFELRERSICRQGDEADGGCCGNLAAWECTALKMQGGMSLLE